MIEIINNMLKIRTSIRVAFARKITKRPEKAERCLAESDYQQKDPKRSFGSCNLMAK